MVRTITLNDGKKMPALAWGMGTGGVHKQDTVKRGVQALEAGIVHFDTAQLYKTEQFVPMVFEAAKRDRADGIWVTSKLSYGPGDDVPTTPEAIRKSVQETLDRLTFIPDLLLIHNPFVPENGKIAEYWQILESLVEDGTLKGCSLGVSNFRPQDLNDVLKVAKIKPVVNQLEYHPYVLSHLDPILKIQKEHNIVTQSYGPLTPVIRHPGGPLKPVLTKVAKRLSTDAGFEIDEASVLLLWTITKGVNAVTTSTKAENLKKMLTVSEMPFLRDDEVDEIDRVGRTVYFRHYNEHMEVDYPVPNLPDGK